MYLTKVVGIWQFIPVKVRSYCRWVLLIGSNYLLFS